MVCKGILRYTVQIPIEFSEGKKPMIREVVACRLKNCPKSRGKHIISERCWREKDE